MKSSVYIVPSFHYDVVYLQDYQTYLERGFAILDRALCLLESSSEYCFLIEQVILAEAYCAGRPDRLAKLKRFTEAGRLPFCSRHVRHAGYEYAGRRIFVSANFRRFPVVGGKAALPARHLLDRRLLGASGAIAPDTYPMRIQRIRFLALHESGFAEKPLSLARNRRHDDQNPLAQQRLQPDPLSRHRRNRQCAGSEDFHKLLRTARNPLPGI